jgi:DNA-binding NarL/FixJ family response regulator
MLSAEQRAVLRLIAQGESDQRICAKVNLDRERFYNCLDELYRELGVSERLELIFFACSEEGKFLLETREAA